MLKADVEVCWEYNAILVRSLKCQPWRNFVKSVTFAKFLIFVKFPIFVVSLCLVRSLECRPLAKFCQICHFHQIGLLKTFCQNRRRNFVKFTSFVVACISGHNYIVHNCFSVCKLDRVGKFIFLTCRSCWSQFINVY